MSERAVVTKDDDPIASVNHCSSQCGLFASPIENLDTGACLRVDVANYARETLKKERLIRRGLEENSSTREQCGDNLVKPAAGDVARQDHADRFFAAREGFSESPDMRRIGKRRT